MSKKADRMLEAAFHEETQNWQKEIDIKYSDDSAKFQAFMNSIYAMAKKNGMNIDDIRRDMNDSLEAARKHRQFNTDFSSIQTDFIFEEAEKRESTGCTYTYYVTNKNDPWNSFRHLYNSRVPYSLDLKSDCRVFYTPLYDHKKSAK